MRDAPLRALVKETKTRATEPNGSNHETEEYERARFDHAVSGGLALYLDRAARSAPPSATRCNTE